MFGSTAGECSLSACIRIPVWVLEIPRNLLGVVVSGNSDSVQLVRGRGCVQGLLVSGFGYPTRTESSWSPAHCSFNTPIHGELLIRALRRLAGWKSVSSTKGVGHSTSRALKIFVAFLCFSKLNEISFGGHLKTAREEYLSCSPRTLRETQID